MIKIISGKYKGSNLNVPRKQTRPTINRARKVIFDTIYTKIAGADVLDCFAGTGAMGIEAISIGANSVTFIENDPDVICVLKKNINKFPILDNTKVFNMDFFKFQTEQKFDIIFIDPPYGKYDFEKLYEFAKQFAKKGGILVHETNDFVVKKQQQVNFKVVGGINIYFLCENVNE